MAIKHAVIAVRNLELGWSGSQGGRTVEFKFFDGKRRIGTLQVSAAALRWRGARKQWSRIVRVGDLDSLFEG